MHRRTILNLTLGTLLIFLTAKATLACFWDRDTLAQEAAGLPGVVEVLLGRIDRWPPEYYAMRLERVTKQLESEPNNLELYDDAAVASDRLKHYDDAIEWMASKRAILDTLPESDPAHTEHEYRYLANLGTHHAHRWIADGGSAQDLADLHRAIELIRAAIDLNPDAHFGREKVQLGFLEALRYSRTAYGMRNTIPFGVFRSTDPEQLATYEPLPEHARYSPSGSDWVDHPYSLEIWSTLRLADENAEVRFLGSPVRIPVSEAIEGLTGLMILGDAWQSIDVHEALIQALYEGRQNSSLALLAACRVAELTSDGSASLLYPRREPHTPLLVGQTIRSQVEMSHQVYTYFRDGRHRVEKINSDRLAFIRSRLNQGMHPDTHPGFWDGYAESSLPDLPDGIAGRAHPTEILGFAAMWGVGFGLALFLVSLALVMKFAGAWKRLGVLSGIFIALAGAVLFTAVLLARFTHTPDSSRDIWNSYDTFRAAMHSNQP